MCCGARLANSAPVAKLCKLAPLLTHTPRNNPASRRYAGQRHVVSVATKLKKFHTVMQECGGVKLGLQV